MALQVAHRIGVQPMTALDMTVHHLRVLTEAHVAEVRDERGRAVEVAWFGDMMARRKKPVSLEEAIGWVCPLAEKPEAAKGRRMLKEKRDMSQRMLERWREAAEFRVS